MAAQLTISDGNNTVDLLATGTTGLQLLESRRTRHVMDPSMFDPVPGDLDSMILVERYTLKLKASSDDNAASQLQTFLRLLRDAWRYHISPTQYKPVYITAQTSGETSVRYALVYRCPEVSGPDFWDYQFDQNDLWTPVTVTIQRFAWQSGVPGVLPTAVTLNPMWAQEALAETGDTSEFDSVTTLGSGAFAADTAAKKRGDYGFKVTLGAAADRGFGSLTGRTSKVVIAETWIDPNSLTMATNDSFVCFMGLGTAGWTFFCSLSFDGSNYQLNGNIYTDGGTTTSTSKYTITDDWHHIRLVWCMSLSAGTNNGSLELIIDGVSKETISSIDNDARDFNSANFGAFFLVDAGTLGTFYMDDCRWSRGPSTPTMLPVANYEDDIDLSYIYNYDDSLAAFSSNFAESNSWTLWEVSGSTPAINDIVYLGGSTDPYAPHVITFDIATAAVYSANITLEYYNGAWTALTYGTEYTIYPAGDEDALFKSVGQWTLFIDTPSDMATVTINGQAAGWFRLKLTAVTTWTTSPAVNTAGGDTFPVHAARKPYFEIPYTAFNGDIPPLLNLRLYSPDGGDETEGFDNISRILIGAKKATEGFHSHLNAGDITGITGWAVADLTDATSTGWSGAPRGTYVSVDFATDTTMVSRVRWTGTNMLGPYTGEYRVFLRAGQAGGAAGDVQVKLRTLIQGVGASDSKFDTAIVKSVTTDITWEVWDLGNIKIPFVPTTERDFANSMASGELYFELHAERTTGTSTLSICDLVLIPVDLWSVELDDPVSDSVNGTSALRGSSMIEMDGGVLANRTIKQVRPSGSGTPTWMPAETWSRGGPALTVEPSTAVRLYFLMMNYPVTFGTPPMVSSLGQGLMAELYGLDRWMGLRGAD